MVLDFSSFDPSVALAAVESCDDSGIVTRTAPGLPPYLALEAMAQSCGLHLRKRHDFRIQAFVASMSSLNGDLLAGEFPLTIRARLVSETAAAASYEVGAEDGPACRMTMGFAASAADNLFRNRFERLCRNRS